MGKLVEIKTRATEASVIDFINSVENEQKRNDSMIIMKMMEKATGEKPRLWGSSIVGFGNKRYKSPNTGREVDWFIIGFSPRKAAITLYVGLSEKMHDNTLKKLGTYKTGVGCLYIKKLEDVDTKILEKIVKVAAKA